MTHGRSQQASARAQSRKRRAVSPDSEANTSTISSRKRYCSGGKENGKMRIASALEALGSSFRTQSPDRQTKAVELIQDDGEFSEVEEIQAISVLTEKKTNITTFLALRNKERRTSYVKMLLVHQER